MTDACNDLVAFADGELDEQRAQEFRTHLASCDACRASLVEAMQLSTRLSTLPPSPPLPIPVPAPRPRPWLHGVRWASAALAAAVLAIVFWPRRDVVGTAFARLETRPYDTRFAYLGAGDYRPRPDPMRGSTGAPRPAFSPTSLAELEQLDPHALALAYAWNGHAPDAVKQLHELESTDAVRSDLAAIEIVTTTNDNLEETLAALASLRGSKDRAVARAARWNYAVLLSRLGLSLSSGQAFETIAADDVPDWSAEARNRAASENQRAVHMRTTWQRAFESGKPLRVAGTQIEPALVTAVPGVLRALFYNAVRTAPNRERVLALAPLARDLDGKRNPPILSDYVQRVAKLDFRRRAELAADYANVLDREPLSPRLERELASATVPDDAIDIVMGTMVEKDLVAGQLEKFRILVARTGDPWFEILLAQAAASVDVGHGDWLGAEVRLKSAQGLCAAPAFTYPCLSLAHDLGKLYEQLHHVPEALDTLRKAVERARTAGEWRRLRQLLLRLADTERFNASTAKARAYANEVALMADDCDYRSIAYHMLSELAVQDGNGPEARRYFDEALTCNPTPTLFAANNLTDIARLDPRPDDLGRLRSLLDRLRAGGTLTPGERVAADLFEARARLPHDRDAAIAMLQRTVTSATALQDVVASNARDGAYVSLIADAASRREYPQTLALIAQDLGLPPPDACTLGMVADEGYSVVAARGADGTYDADYVPGRRPHDPPPTVSSALAIKLAGCAQVRVLAHGALQGRPRILPPAMAWSYVTGQRRTDRPGPASTPPRALVVTDVTPPAELGLEPLSAPTAESSPGTQILSGPAATPRQVVAAMRDATEIQFHTHALVDMSISDASYLVLSPEPDHRYALTAETIRSAQLAGQPIIVLAACHSAQGARYKHAPWSLPHAFLSVGARAVLAAGAEIPDREAGPFFAHVLQRIRSGAAPAVALRDERVAVLASNPSSWVADVMVFD